MKAKNCVLVLAWAAVTFVATLAMFQPAMLDAVNSAVKPEIMHPRMTARSLSENSLTRLVYCGA